jgi:hypothetical protein
MTELINKLEKIIEVLKLDLTRRKKKYEVFIDEADNYYVIMSLLISIKSWEDCLKLIKKYFETRDMIENLWRSKEFETLFELNKRYNSSYISEKDRYEILEYMRVLEWRIESFKREKNKRKWLSWSRQ